MALGCAFIFVLVLMCWRRRARKQRAQRTAMFASAKKLNQKSNWRWRLVRFGEKLFGHNASRRAAVLPIHRPQDNEHAKLQKMREAEDVRHDLEMDDLLDSYNYSKAESRLSRAPSSLPSLHKNRATKFRALHPPSHSNRLSGHSLYSEVTGKPRQMPEPRQPIRKDLLDPRYSSSSTLSSSFSIWTRERDRVLATVPPPVPQPPTEAEAYASAVRPALAASPPLNPGSYWMQPHTTGGSSRNPFRQ
jgi:hypothetical protein